MRAQFTPDEEERAHAALLDRIAAARVLAEPEPDHEPARDTTTINVLGSTRPVRIVAHWCCDWHRHAGAAP